VLLLVTAAALTPPLSADVPDEVVWIPDGKHTITPSVNGKPKQVVITIPEGKGNQIAAKLETDLQRRLSENVLPIIAFDHATTGPKAGTPKSFRYEQGKGILLTVDWSSAGRNAVSGRDFSYFSPAFLIDDNGVPSGIPARGEIGSLVNNPAFREIPRISASDHEDPLNPNTEKMHKLILAALNISDTAADAEGAAVIAVNAMKSEITTVKASVETLKTEKKELADKLEAAEGKIKEAAETRAKDLVEAAVTDGRILPKDDTKKAFYTRLIAAGDSDAETMLKDLPKINKDLSTPIVKAGQDKPATKKEGDDEPKGLDAVHAAFAEEIEEKAAV